MAKCDARCQKKIYITKNALLSRAIFTKISTPAPIMCTRLYEGTDYRSPSRFMIKTLLTYKNLNFVYE
jgi:hypothetical protein